MCNFSDPFGLCKNAKGEELPPEQCRDVSASEGEAIRDAAEGSEPWTYTQGRAGEPPKNFCANYGDCTDFVEKSMRAAGMPALNPRPATFQFDGNSSYRALGAEDSPQAGDVIVIGGHAGIMTGARHASGRWMAISNGSRGVSTYSWGPGVNGLSSDPIQIYRRQVPR